MDTTKGTLRELADAVTEYLSDFSHRVERDVLDALPGMRALIALHENLGNLYLAGGWVYDGRAVEKIIQAVRRGDLPAAAEAADEAERIRDQAAQIVARRR